MSGRDDVTNKGFMSQAHKINADVLWPSLAYNMAACNKLPAACPRKTIGHYFSFYYHFIITAGYLYDRIMMPADACDFACSLSLSLLFSRFYHSINYK